ncbi:protein phosphatase 2C domain-containing protein [Microbispora hainanensis]|nr:MULTISPECIES: protein phosphatase 2C domain-containing protein [Microbispora]
MPLARIRRVCDLPAQDAAEEVAAYWRQVTAETRSRDRLAAFLVDHLSGRGSAVQDATTTLEIRYAARSEPGPVRTSNEDIAYADERLLAVADGMRGQGGDRASAAAVDALNRLLTLPVPAEDLLGAIADAVGDAERAIREIAASVPSGEAVTTLTALVWSGSRPALVHIGDSRAYLFRGGGLFQITHDHSYVQSLIDEGRLTPEEAASHPRRSLLVRALTGAGSSLPDLSMREAAPGDRYLLCTDGLPGVVPARVLRETLGGPGGPQQVVDELIDRAYAAGAPDNVACVVADVTARPAAEEDSTAAGEAGAAR